MNIDNTQPMEQWIKEQAEKEYGLNKNDPNCEYRWNQTQLEKRKAYIVGYKAALSKAEQPNAKEIAQKAFEGAKKAGWVFMGDRYYFDAPTFETAKAAYLSQFNEAEPKEVNFCVKWGTRETEEKCKVKCDYCKTKEAEPKGQAEPNEERKTSIHINDGTVIDLTGASYDAIAAIYEWVHNSQQRIQQLEAEIKKLNNQIDTDNTM
jgi:hypothetical protein